MTPAEIEAELASLRARLAQVEDEQDRRQRQWSKLGIEYRWYTFAFAGAGIAFGLVSAWFHGAAVPSPLGLTFVLVAIVLSCLVRALLAATSLPR